MPAGGRASGKDDGMFYITGDTYGQFGRIEAFCQRFGTRKDDVMIILGDAGINFSGGIRDRMKKELLEALPVTIFAIHGNHEQRPQTIGSYKEKLWHGGVVYYEEKYPSLLFAKDGEVFNWTGSRRLSWAGHTALIRWCGSCMGMAGGRMNSPLMKSNSMWRASLTGWVEGGCGVEPYHTANI